MGSVMFCLRNFCLSHGHKNAFLMKMSSRAFIVLTSTFGIDCCEPMRVGVKIHTYGYPALFIEKPIVCLLHCSSIFAINDESDYIRMELCLNSIQFCLFD